MTSLIGKFKKLDIKDVSKSSFKEDFALFKRLNNDYIKPHYKSFGLAIFFMIMVAALTACYTFIVQSVLDKIFVEKNSQMLLYIPLVIILVGFCKNFATYAQSTIMGVTIAKINNKLRFDYCKYFLHTDISNTHDKTSADVVVSLAYQINGITGGLTTLMVALIRESITILALVGVLFYKNPKLAFLGTIGFPIAILPLTLLSRKIRKMLRTQQVDINSFSGMIDDTLKSPKIVKAYNAESFEEGRIETSLNIMLKISKKIIKFSNISGPLMEGIGTLSFAFVVWYGGYQVINGTTSPGVFFAFLTSMVLAYKPAKNLSGINIAMQSFFMNLKSYYSELDNKPNIISKPDAKKISNFEDSIVFENVTFSYPNGFVALKNANIVIKKGQKVALVGKTGSGKSTITNLLLRFYDASDGRILIDGTDIRDIDTYSLRSLFSFVGQDVSLFNDTIANNIKYNIENATQNQIELAAKKAHADEFIERLEDKYNFQVGQYGVKLSGGQKQRIIVARAILHDKPFLVLDEATSSLDSVSEKYIKEALDDLMTKKTSLIVAHRLSTIKEADVIYVVNEGEIVESGNHKALMEKKMHYAKFYNTQHFE